MRAFMSELLFWFFILLFIIGSFRLGVWHGRALERYDQKVRHYINSRVWDEDSPPQEEA